MSWGINPNAPQHEKIFAEFADNLGGMNSCGDIDYDAYSTIWDMARAMLEKTYEQGKADATNNIWHNLKELPEDTPDTNRFVEVRTEDEFPYYFGWYEKESGMWFDAVGFSMNPFKWREIEEEVSK